MTKVVVGARSAPSRHCQPAKGESPGTAVNQGRAIGWFITGTLASIALSIAAAQTTKTVWDGVYSEAQAGRGKKAYIINCAACHNEGLQGGDLAPELKGESFLLRWNDKSMFEFVDRIQKTMPQDNPGGLSAEANSDIVAYILQVNKMTPGGADLSTDAAALKAITITTSK